MRHMGTALLTMGVVLMLVGGWFAFLGAGGWKLLGSRYEDRTSIESRVTEIQIAKPGLAKIDIQPAAGSTVEFSRTVRYLSPFTHRPGQTHRVEGTTLYLDQCGMAPCAIDYTVLVPDGVHVSR
jgi:hypothetical protein